MRFHFIHAADLHIDSPLAGLGQKDAEVARRFAEAGRKAVERLIEETIASRAAFLLIAGDIFDGDWKDYASGLFFVGQLGKLHRGGIKTFIIKGNHDAESLMSRALPYPDSVTMFRADRAETVVLDEHGIALHGRSFPQRHVPPDFLESYPKARDGFLNIGLLHTSLDGKTGEHAAYAPCTPEDLRRFGYQYWALGHIHAAEHVSRDPWIVFPGNIQGRSIRETGAKGAVRVTVENGRIVETAPVVLDAARWVLERVDVGGCADEALVLDRVDAALAAIHAGADGRPLAVRLSLVGPTPLHAHLVAHAERLRNEARALGLRFADDCWIESLRIDTEPPARRPVADGDALDVVSLLDAATDSPAFAAAVDDLIAAIRGKMPREIGEALPLDPQALRRLARDHLLGRVGGMEN